MLKNKMLSAMGGAPANYIEDVFSTYLYTGNGSTQTINNGIDLAGEGGLVWTKCRDQAYNHWLFDTNRGVNKVIHTNTTAAQATKTVVSLTAFNSSGYTVVDNGSGVDGGSLNYGNFKYASWTFRKQPKFFDVVTYTGNGSARTIAHNLGSVPGCIIIKSTTAATSWAVYHTGLGNANFLTLNSANASTASSAIWNSTSPTSTVFTIGTSGAVNDVGQTYVAYLFAHDAGGFGESGEDNVISCGSFTGNGSTNGPTVTLGYEPQWLMIKRVDSTGDWPMFDNMRGIPVTGNTQRLDANGTQDEATISAAYAGVSATGFYLRTANANFNASGGTYIYIAIRRGPMKVPTSGTSVLGLNARAGTGANATVTGGAGVTDLAIIKRRNSTSNWVWTPRLAGTGYLSSNLTTAETAAGTTILQANPWDVMDGVKVGTTSTLTNASGSTFINYLLDRAPGFMDVVCRNGTGANATQAHNLAVAPEFVITKKRSAVNEWYVTHSFTATGYQRQYFEQTAAASSHLYTDNFVWTARPTASSLFFGSNSNVNQSGQTFVDYLFATCPNVSKVGSYTGNGATQVINCGFTGGARFVLIKCTTAAESWHVFDTARGMVAGTDPRLRPNTTDSENTGNWVYTATTGFELVTSDAAVNSTGNTYIFLAIA